MKKFIVSYHAPLNAAWKTAESSPEAKEAGIKAWMDWARKCGNKLVDFGTPLGNGMELVSGESPTGSTSTMIGYSILQAEHMEEAIDLLKGHPHLEWNEACRIEIHESLAVPGS